MSTGAFNSSSVYEVSDTRIALLLITSIMITYVCMSSQVMTEHFLPLVEQHDSKCRQELQNTEVHGNVLVQFYTVWV